MSKYEMLDYDELLRRVGIEPGTTWFCGSNPPSKPGDPGYVTYEEAGVTYDDFRWGYDGRNQAHAELCLSEDINVNGLLLNHRDRNGTIWICTGIDGWWTLPPAEIPEVPKPYWDGNMLTTGRYLARTITVTGIFMPPHPSLVWYNRDALLRVSSIVRGIGLLAVCGNESPYIDDDDPFFDPPKMATIQMADTPLIETTRKNGFTQFSLAFRCFLPTKLSLYEKEATMPIESGTVVRTRLYKSFALTAAEDTGPTSQYTDVRNKGAGAGTRRYSEVETVNLDSLIEDEELTESVDPDETAYIQTAGADVIVLRNSGNYFAFPVFVFDKITGTNPAFTTGGVPTPKVVTLRNLTTGESMQIQKDVASGNQLVIDTNLRRVFVGNPATDAADWTWDDRSHLTLASEWISLAPGDNTLIVSPSPGVVVPSLPRVYWRDTWIG